MIANFVSGLVLGVGLTVAAGVMLDVRPAPDSNRVAGQPPWPDDVRIALEEAAGGEPIGTTSFEPVMMGLGTKCSITPTNSGVVSFKLIGVIVNDISSDDGATVQMRYGTGIAPSNGSFDIGTPAGIKARTISNLVTLYNIKAKVKDLTLYTPYWFDAALNAEKGGLARIDLLRCEASED